MLDVNSDMITDFIYVSTSNEIKVAVGKSKNSTEFEIKDFTEFTFTSEDDPACKTVSTKDLISTPHSNSFLDLNGDCMPDIFMSKIRKVNENKYEQYHEIYLSKIINEQ
mmetsp:Transcript_17128/g.26485  ORF Transcript_17128/g.26485 Transcript_17128/m.26485 type:complete len:109 (+) Transcript_17128:1-327(+)